MDKIECIVRALDDKLATHITAIDMRMSSPMFDTFVICSASNERLMHAIKESVKDECEKNGYVVKRVEGGKDSKWLLVDVGDVVVHIFDKNERENYNLEKLWGDMPHIDISGFLS
jgi:ribosome-associated protein